ncbi:MAG: peptide chain release factor N(5)-glutamine methyltransferase [Sedimentisphaerales bacterium]|nr:peptide chain release factor N(5)-glutamine methyltransferase [Sedimentisphaerales bacterium]
MESPTEQKTEWTIKSLLEWTAEYFGRSGVEQPRLCAEILLAYVLDCQRIELYVKFDHCPGAEQLSEFRRLVKRCAEHEPVGYLVGKAHFFSLEFEVSPAVLIPRPETETLVAQAIDFCRHQTMRPRVEVLDLCCGSGCVAAAIAANVVEVEVVAVDNSPQALQIAEKNVQKHELTGRVTLLESDLFEKVAQSGKGIFDLIVSNPPYISTEEYEKLSPMVRDYEPSGALLAGADGLEVIRRIIEQAEPWLADDGALMIEIAYNQSEQVIALFEKAGYLGEVRAIKDGLNHDRVVQAIKA